MKILAADTSTPSGSVALLDGATLMAEWTLHSAMTHNRRLLQSVDILLAQVGWEIEQIDGFAVTVGPGSFTGIRIGLTTMKTMAWALGKPYVGISTLDALAAPLCHASIPVCALVDARKGEVYSALYQADGGGGMTRLVPPAAVSPERLAEQIERPTLVCGDGWLSYRSLLEDRLGPLAIPAPAPCHAVRAGFVAELARARLLAGGSQDPMESIPLYVRPSEAELKSR